MKHTLPLLSLLSGISFSTTVLAQTIQNPGFETPRDTNRALPAGWKVTNQASYTVALDSTVTKNGRRSLRIASMGEGPFTSGGFSQTATVQLSEPRLVHLRGFVKTDNPSGIGVWWNSWRDEKHRGFAHSNQQVSLRRTDEWQPLDLVLPASADINWVSFGAYLNGRGSVWFDDLRFDTDSAKAGEPSARAKAYLTKAITLVKKHALVRDSIPWPQTEAELMAFARGMQSESETYPLIDHLLNLMWQYGDNHSHFLTPSGVRKLEADESNDSYSQPQARYLGDRVGYVAVPGFLGIKDTRITTFARQVQQLIQSIDTARTVTGWVVDLRQNEGGNMTPMIAGLGPLLGEGTLGYFLDGKREVPWGYRNGRFYVKKTRTTISAPYRLRQADARVAVLIGPRTSSSGEMTAISFIGRPDTRFFGLPSGGYTTANKDFKLPGNTLLFLAYAGTADRTHKKYPHGIIPDEEIKAPTTGTTDPTLDAAKAWLMKK